MDEARNYQFQIVTKDLSHLSKAYLVPLADLHEGCRDADHEVSDGYIKWIAEHADAFTILNGDMLNCAWKDSTPELYEDLITPDDAYANLRTRLLPIKDKILMITRGGHEESIYRKVGVDFMARLAYDLGNVPYRPDGGMVAMRLCLRNHHLIFYIYATHGWGGARTIGAKVKKPEDISLGIQADCIVVSHDHTQAIHRLNVLTPPRSKQGFSKPQYMQVRRVLLINTGGFVLYSGYIRRKGYVPQDLGTPRIRLEIKQETSRRSSLPHSAYYKDLHSSI